MKIVNTRGLSLSCCILLLFMIIRQRELLFSDFFPSPRPGLILNFVERKLTIKLTLL